MMIPTGILQPHNESEYQKLEQKYFELGNFIRSLWVHTEGEDKGDYGILKREMTVLGDRVNEKIIVMDAFEQNSLKPIKPTLPIDIHKKEKKAPGRGNFGPKMAATNELADGLES